MLYTGILFSELVARGYQIEKIKEKLIDVLNSSKTSLSGIEIAKKLKINRVTMSKYLKIFAAEGLIAQKNIGGINLWVVEEGVEQLHFPNDYFQAKNKYLQYVYSEASREAYNILRTSLHSGAEPRKIVTEVVVPAIYSIRNSYDDGKISKLEKSLRDGIILESMSLINSVTVQGNLKKNVVVFSTDSQNILLAQAASTVFFVEEWNVSKLWDMSSAIGVMFDIDLQKFLNKIWIKKQGIMIVVMFSSEETSIKFFSEAVNSLKAKFGKNFYFVVYTNLTKKTKADFVSDNLDLILQWCQTTYESSNP